MKIACGSLCFTRESFDSACAHIAKLGFRAIDIAVMQGWAHFDAANLVERLDAAIATARQALDRYGLTPVALNASAGTSDVAAETARFEAICEFANALGVPVICYVAPVEAVGLDRALRRYERLRDIAVAHDVILAVEAHARTMLEYPDTAIQFCEALGEVYLTLDPSHMVAGPNQGAPFDRLYPYVRHTHWRDSGDRWENCQVPVGEGIVDFPSIVEGLRASGYDGAYAVEYIDTFPNGGPANIRDMKMLLESYLEDRVA